MSKELVVSSNRHETKLAILEDDRLVEIYVERRSNQAIAGSIYKGRVSRVLPGMQSAFVKLGLARDAFLYVSDVLDQTAELEDGDAPDLAETADEQPANGGGAGRRRSRRLNSRRRDSGLSGGESEDDAQNALEAQGAGEESGRSAGRRPGRRRGRRRRDREDDRRRIRSGGVERVEAAASEDRGAPPGTEDGGDAAFEVLPGESLSKYGAAGEGPAADEDAGAVDDQAVDADYQELDAADERDEDAAGGVLDAPNDLNDDIEYDDEIEDESDEPAAAAGNGEDQDETVPGGAQEEQAAEQAADDGAQRTEDAEDAQPAAGGEPDADAAGGEAPETAAALSTPAESSRLQRRSRRGRRRGRHDAEASNGAQGGENGVEDPPLEAKPASSDSDALPNIKDLLDPGQELIVQIAKEPLGKKGARITSHVALPGRFMVYMPTVNHNGVSKKVRSDSERARLRRIVKAHAAGKPGGFIVRTAGRGASEEELQADLEFLYKQWQGILEKAEKRRAPALLYHDLDVVERVLRDQLGQSYKTIWVDGEEEYERVLRFVERFQPDLLDRVKFYTRSMPIYDEFNISQELEKALRPKVWLKSGGYLVITQTEALVAIDVNTGKYVGKSDRLEDTIVKINMEAAEEVVRQMRLRDLGGIVIVDFIDMEDSRNRQNVYRTIEAALRRDRAPAKALPFNDFGLIAITRKRVKQSLERALCMPCPTCAGSGTVKSAPTVISEILNESRKMALDAEETKDVVLRVYPAVAKVLKARSNSYLRELEETFQANVLIRGDAEMSPEQFSFH